MRVSTGPIKIIRGYQTSWAYLTYWLTDKQGVQQTMRRVFVDLSYPPGKF